jgi:hypothetical protein
LGKVNMRGLTAHIWDSRIYRESVTVVDIIKSNFIFMLCHLANQTPFQLSGADFTLHVLALMPRMLEDICGAACSSSVDTFKIQGEIFPLERAHICRAFRMWRSCSPLNVHTNRLRP